MKLPESKLPKVGTTIFTIMSQLAARHQAINLGQGFPDFDGPPALIEALGRHASSGRNQYAPMTGILPLREQIGALIGRAYGRQLDIEQEITVTSGASEALFAGIAALIRPGDEAIVLDPCYDSYDPAIRVQGGLPVHVPLDPQSFRIDYERLAAAINGRTRLLIINTPHNPSGAMLEREDLDRIAELLRPTRAWLISDEVYEHIRFDGRAHHSVLSHDELYQRSLVVSSFGKTYHLTGWKVGYCVAAPALSAEMRKVHQYITFCTMSPAQWALADYLAAEPEEWSRLGAFYQLKRDLFADLLSATPLRLVPAEGAYFQIADYSAISDEDDRSFAERLVRDFGVAVIPVSAFYESPPPGLRMIRFCFAKQEQTLRAAAACLRRLSD